MCLDTARGMMENGMKSCILPLSAEKTAVKEKAPDEKVLTLPPTAVCCSGDTLLREETPGQPDAGYPISYVRFPVFRISDPASSLGIARNMDRRRLTAAR